MHEPSMLTGWWQGAGSIHMTMTMLTNEALTRMRSCPCMWHSPSPAKQSTSVRAHYRMSYPTCLCPAVPYSPSAAAPPHVLPLIRPFIPCTEVHPKVWLSFRMASVHGYTRDSATPVPAGSTALCVCPSVCIPPGASMQRNQAPLTCVTSFSAKQADFPSQAKLPPTSKPFA